MFKIFSKNTADHQEQRATYVRQYSDQKTY